METELLIARINDTADLCERTSVPKFLGFLSREESVFAEKILNRRNVKFDFYGGYDEADRLVLGCFPDWCEEEFYPISSVTFSYRKEDSLAHRDILGFLMSLGIKRETVGDILIEEGRAVVFLNEDIVSYVLTQTEKVGRTGVTVSEGFTEPLPLKSELAEFSVTVASERLDCIVSALAGISRKTASEKIISGEVSINSVVCEKTTAGVSEGDILTVKKKGKFIIDSFGGKTRKDRLIINYKKYI